MHFSSLQNLTGKSILIVEDEYLVANDLKDYIVDMGATVVGPVATIDEARKLAYSQKPDCAIMDINFRGEMSFDLIDQFVAQALPVLLVSGYDLYDLPEAYRGLPYLQKLTCIQSGTIGKVINGLVAP